MAVYTDNPRFAAIFLPSELAGGLVRMEGRSSAPPFILTPFFRAETPLFSSPSAPLPWSHVLLSEHAPRSQYDQLIQMARTSTDLPGGIACLAGSGSDFHGFKGRSWAALPGNVHLSVHLLPRRKIDRLGIAFTVLASLSVVEALDRIAGLEGTAQIKWVNDILLGEAKVGGVLAYTQSQGELVTSAILGIGLNVETTPEVDPTPFVPQVGSVRQFHPNAMADLRRLAFTTLLTALEENYRILLEEGASPLVDRYRSRSMVVGREVTVCTEDSDHETTVVARGRVSALGENLELWLEGRADPVRGGRLILGELAEEGRGWG